MSCVLNHKELDGLANKMTQLHNNNNKSIKTILSPIENDMVILLYGKNGKGSG